MMNINQAYGNIQHACNECPLTQAERIAVDEALLVVVQELNSFEALKKQVKNVEQVAEHNKKVDEENEKEEEDEE